MLQRDPEPGFSPLRAVHEGGSIVQPCAEGHHDWRDESKYAGQRYYVCTICGATGSGY
jgi:hypothetical protein